MRKCLRKVPQMSRRFRVVLFGIKAKRRSDSQKPLQQIAGLLHLSDDRECRDEPEGTDHECSFLAGESIVGLLGAVTQDEAVLSQLPGDSENGAFQAFVVMRQKSEACCQQCRSVERVRPVMLAQHAPVTDTVSEDVRLDLVRRPSPRRRSVWVA